MTTLINEIDRRLYTGKTLDDIVEGWRRLHRARARATDVVYLTAPEAAALAAMIRGRNRTPLRLFDSYVVIVPEELLR